MIPKTHVLIRDLYNSLGRKILSTILKRNGGDLQVAEQVLQDTFVAAYKSFNSFQHKSSYFTWLTRIALNKLADYYRDQVNSRSKIFYPTLKQLSNIEDKSLSQIEKITLQELQEKVNICLNLLPDEYRNLLQLKYYKEMTNKEICISLNLSERKLEGRLYRAKKSLAKLITKSEI